MAKREKLAEVERKSSLGTTVRLKLRPLEGGMVEIVEYRRRKKGAKLFFRDRYEEGQRVRFELLKLKQSWAELFGPQERLL